MPGTLNALLPRRGLGGLRERGQLPCAEAAQVVAPVQDPGEPGGPAGVVLEHEADATAA